MTSFSYAKPEDLANFPPPDGEYTVTTPKGSGTVQITGGVAISYDPDDKREERVPLTTLGQIIKSVVDQGGAVVFNAVESKMLVYVIGGVALLGAAWYWMSRKKGAA